MIAYHYPPCAVSSGQQRTLGFSRHLSKHGWEPTVLTVRRSAYSRVDWDETEAIPSTMRVVRTWALDTKRHLSIRSRYPGWLALPDPWVSWVISAVPVGLNLIRQYKPKIIWSTYPIATAHLIGHVLHKITNIPWVADFRDPMNEIDPVTRERWPKDQKVWKVREWVEKNTCRSCSRAVFVTSGALQMYSERYSEIPARRWALIPNGFSEESFIAAERLRNGHLKDKKGIVLLHSGVLYPTPDRNPATFFAALAELQRLHIISPENLRVVLRASSSEDLYQRQILEHGIQNMVKLEPPLPYKQALAEMLDADGLLVFQGRDSNCAIPAKIYEYFRARRPIFAMVDEEGNTADALRQAGITSIVPLSSAEHIVAGLRRFLGQVRDGTAAVASEFDIARHSRESQARILAQLFDSVLREQPTYGEES